MKDWLKFVLRVVGMLVVFVVMTLGYLQASRGTDLLDTLARECAHNARLDKSERVVEMEREYSRNRDIGIVIMAVGGVLFLLSCYGLVKRSSKKRKAGIAVVTLMGAIVCYMTVMATSYRVRRTKIVEARGDEIRYKADLKVARIEYENAADAPNFSNVVEHLESAFSHRTGEDAWGHGVLAECYLYGRGCERDLERSRLHADIAAKLSDVRGKDILKRLEEGDLEPAPDPVRAILDVTGVDVMSVQMTPRREIVAPKPIGFFRKGSVTADGEGKINGISFLGNYGKGCAVTNGLSQIEKILPDIRRRLDCSLIQAIEGPNGCVAWYFRFNQTHDWIVGLQLYTPRNELGPQVPLLVRFIIAGLEQDGNYHGIGCRFKRVPLSENPALRH